MAWSLFLWGGDKVFHVALDVFRLRRTHWPWICGNPSAPPQLKLCTRKCHLSILLFLGGGWEPAKQNRRCHLKTKALSEALITPRPNSCHACVLSLIGTALLLALLWHPGSLGFSCGARVSVLEKPSGLVAVVKPRRVAAAEGHLEHFLSLSSCWPSQDFAS